MVTENEKYQILRFVRRTVGAELEVCPEPDMPELELLRENIACFVEIIGMDGEPRGCMGNIEPFETLGENLRRHALNAAFGDPSFPPLEPEELNEVTFAVSLVSPPCKLASPGEIVPGRHGLVIQQGEHRAAFHPRIIAMQRWDGESALKALCRKAGLPEDGYLNSAWQAFELEIMGEKS